MTISSSLNASVAGLASNATRLAAISDNIANSATFGYKRAVTDFHSMVNGNGPGSYAAGGIRTSSTRLIDQSASLVSTGNSTDLAVRGRGLLPVMTESDVAIGNGEDSLLLSTTGSFRPDALGYLRSPAGLVLMGWPATASGDVPAFPRDSIDGLEPIQINSAQFAGEATTRIDLAVNLPATSTEADSGTGPETLSVEYFDNLGKSSTLNLSFTPTVPAAGSSSSNQWTLVVSDSESAGAIIGEYTINFDATRGGGGTILSVVDVSGGPYDSTTGELSLNVAGGPIDISIGTPGSAVGLTQLSNAFAPTSISKNGTPVGSMTSIEVDKNGYVRASFDIGITRTLYQIPLVDVSNVNGLETQDSQTYRATNDSGSFFLWDAGDGPTGDIVGFAREESATDVAGELTQLIQTQRAYSSNAKVIQTVDEMLQETTNIKR
jgi:flagellar hook protein FlgE